MLILAVIIITIMQNLGKGFVAFQRTNFIALIAILLGGIMFLVKKEKADFYFLLTSGMSSFLFIYVGGQHYDYYSFILSIFVPMGLVYISQILQNICQGKKYYINFKLKACLVGIICLIFTFCCCRNTYLLHYHRSDMPQYKFAKIIKRKPNATLLNYGWLDCGFYTTTGIVPNCKFFCRQNIPLKNMLAAQNGYIKSGKVDFVITRDSQLKSNLYKCITNTKFFYEGKDHTFYLYKIIKEKDGK